MHRAIETRYSGYRFRSRLEARYAVLFDSLGIKWDYEPEGFELGGGKRYLPDFFVHYPDGSPERKKWPGAGYWVEIKASTPTPAECEKLSLLCAQTKHHGYFFFGPPERGESWGVSARNPFRPPDPVPGEGFRPPYGVLWAAPVSCCAAKLQNAPGGLRHNAHSFHKTFDDAVDEAKGARFEFGQSGARA